MQFHMSLKRNHTPYSFTLWLCASSKYQAHIHFFRPDVCLQISGKRDDRIDDEGLSRDRQHAADFVQTGHGVVHATVSLFLFCFFFF